MAALRITRQHAEFLFFWNVSRQEFDWQRSAGGRDFTWKAAGEERKRRGEGSVDCCAEHAHLGSGRHLPPPVMFAPNDSTGTKGGG